MTIFIDTGVWSAARNIRDDLHQDAKTIVGQILDGNYGRSFTSDYVFGEMIILAIVRTKLYATARDVGEFILGFPNLSFLFTPESVFQDAWNIHGQYADKPLSFTDCTIISWCNTLNIDHIASFDEHFDGIVERVII